MNDNKCMLLHGDVLDISTDICSLSLSHYQYVFVVLNAVDCNPTSRFSLIRVRFKPLRAPVSLRPRSLTASLSPHSSSSLRCPDDHVTTCLSYTGCLSKCEPASERQRGLWEEAVRQKRCHTVMQEHKGSLVGTAVQLSHP